MKNKDLEKYITELSPELQEKVRQCKDMEELNKLLADNDVELSEDALEAVAGGCSCSDSYLDQGDIVDADCPECGDDLHYWDAVFGANRYYCCNISCIACKEHYLYSWNIFEGLHRVK